MSDEQNGNGNGNGHVVVRTCPACHRPVDDEGVTFFRGVGTKQQGGDEGATCHTCGYGWRNLFVRRKSGEQLEDVRKGHIAQRKRPMTDVMAERMEAVLDKVLAPYFEGLELKPNPEWSPRTKLQFFNEQSSLSEKLFNRTEGLPVARQRNVDRADNDLAPMKKLPQAALERVLSAALAEIDLSAEEIYELAEGDVSELDEGGAP